MSYPTSVWNGDTPNRDASNANLKRPDGYDWNTVAAELIATQTELDAVKAGTSALDYLNLPKTGYFNLGAYAAAYATGSAVVVDDTKTAAAGFYAETVEDVTSAYMTRAIRGRHLIVTDSGTVAQETYGIQGQVCVKNTTLTHLHAGLLGTFEVSTAATLNSAYAFGHAGVLARVGATASVITATTPLCGFLAFWNGSDALGSGKSVAYAATSVSATYRWSIGMYMPVGSVTEAIRIGDWVSGAATTGGLPFTTALNVYSDGQLDLVQVHGASSADLTSAYSAKCGRFRHVIKTSSATVAHETYGLIGQVVVRDTTLTHLHAGLMGTLEVNTAATFASSYDIGHAAVIGRIGLGSAVTTATTPAAGILAFNNNTGSVTGKVYAFAAASAGTDTWDALLAASKCDYLLWVASATAYEAGVKVASITNLPTDGTASGVIRILVDTTPYYIPIFASATGV